jgi:hypothetical protein
MNAFPERSNSMGRKSAGYVVMGVASLLWPSIPHAQELTADVVIHKANGTEARGKLYRGKDAVRLEPPEEGQGAAKGGIVIYDVLREATYFLNPAMKAYVERPGSAAGGPVSLFVPQKDNPCALLPRVSKDAACQKMGAESVNGRKAEKWQATQTRGGRTITEYAWVDSEWHIAIKWTTSDQSTGQLENIHLGAQPVNLFALPSDYRKMEIPPRVPANH